MILLILYFYLYFIRGVAKRIILNLYDYIAMPYLDFQHAIPCLCIYVLKIYLSYGLWTYVS